MDLSPGTPALELAEQIRSGALSSRALLDATFARIDALDPQLNAFVQLRPRGARREAARADRRADRADLPTFWGVPSGLKDLQAIRGMHLRVGSRAMRHVWTPYDGAVARRFRRGGFVLAGKLSTSELALMPVVEPDLHPPTANPWDPAHTAGGSSGGSAAAVAAGLVAIAQASDGAGSIRIPAAFCHLFGFKPSRGFLPHFHGRMERLQLASVGPVAHTVRDAAALLDVLRGDPRPHRSPDSLLQACANAPGALRVRVCTDSWLIDVDPRIAALTDGVAAALASLGHEVDSGEPADGALDEFLPVYGRMAAALPVLAEKTLQPVTRWLRQQGRGVSWPAATAIRDALSLRVAAWFGDVDLWVTPTVGCLPPKVGGLADADPEAHFRNAARLGAFTAVFNISGQPAATIPAGLVDGLPVGVQIVAQRGQDVLLMQVCRQLEEALPWIERSRRVPMSG